MTTNHQSFKEENWWFVVTEESSTHSGPQNSADSELITCFNRISLTVCKYVIKNNKHKPFSKLQKKSIRIIHKVGFGEHTNTILKSNLFKFNDLVLFKTVQFIFKVRDEELPGNLQKHVLLQDEERLCKLRGAFKP